MSDPQTDILRAYGLPTFKIDVAKPEDIGNLAEDLDDAQRAYAGTAILDLVEIDKQTQSGWASDAKRYLDNLIANQAEIDYDAQDDKAGNEDQRRPSLGIVLQAMTQFNGRATDALIGEAEIVKPTSTDGGAKALAEWTSDYLRNTDRNWITDTDKISAHASVVGLAWRKRTTDRLRKTMTSDFLPFGCVTISADATSVGRAPRVTHHMSLFPHEIAAFVEAGVWIEPRLENLTLDPQAEHRFDEIHCMIDLDDDGVDEPWTVTVSCEPAEIVAIWPRWSAAGVIKNKVVGRKGRAREVVTIRAHNHFTPYPFIPDPRGKFHALGYGWALERYERITAELLAAAIDTVKTTAEDGGVMSGIGFGVSETVQVKRGRINILPANDGRPISEIYTPFMKHGLDQSVPTMIENLLKIAANIGGGVNQLTQMPGDASATMANGVIQGEAQAHSAVYRRMHLSMTAEIRDMILMAADMGILPDELKSVALKSVALSADPVISTELARAQMVQYYGSFKDDPFTNQTELRQRMHQLMRVPDPQKLIQQPSPPGLDPKDQSKAAYEFQKLAMQKELDQSVIAKNYAQAEVALQAVQENFAQLAMDMAQFKVDLDALRTGQQPGSPPMGSQPGGAGAGSPPGPAAGGAGQQMGVGPSLGSGPGAGAGIAASQGGASGPGAFAPGG